MLIKRARYLGGPGYELWQTGLFESSDHISQDSWLQMGTSWPDRSLRDRGIGVGPGKPRVMSQTSADKPAAGIARKVAPAR